MHSHIVVEKKTNPRGLQTRIIQNGAAASLAFHVREVPDSTPPQIATHANQALLRGNRQVRFDICALEYLFFPHFPLACLPAIAPHI